MRAKDRCQALLESLDAARLNTSSPGAYSAWMSWFCRQSHSKECGPNFPGEVMASGADFHTNSTTRCWDATRAVLSRALARCGGVDENAPRAPGQTPTPAGAPAASGTRAAATPRRQSLGEIAPNARDGRANAPKRSQATATGAQRQQQPVARAPAAPAAPRRGRTKSVVIAPVPPEAPGAAPLATASSVCAPLEAGAAYEFVLHALDKGWDARRAEAEARRYFVNTGWAMTRSQLEEILADAVPNQRRVTRPAARAIRAARKTYKDRAAASNGWLPMLPSTLPIVDFRRALLGLRRDVAAATAAAFRARREPTDGLPTDALLNGRTPIPVSYIVELDRLLTSYKLSASKATAVLRDKCATKEMKFSGSWGHQALRVLDCIRSRALGGVTRRCENFCIIHDGGSTTVASKGIGLKFTVVLISGHLAAGAPPRCAMAWAGDAVSHALALAARLKTHVPRHFLLARPVTKPTNVWLCFVARGELDTAIDGRLASSKRMSDASLLWWSLPDNHPRKVAARAEAQASADAVEREQAVYDAVLARARVDEATATKLASEALFPDAPAARQTATAAMLLETHAMRPGCLGLGATTQTVRADYLSRSPGDALVVACRDAAERLACRRMASQRSLLKRPELFAVGDRGHLELEIPTHTINALARGAGLATIAAEAPPPRAATRVYDPMAFTQLYSNSPAGRAAPAPAPAPPTPPAPVPAPAPPPIVEPPPPPTPPPEPIYQRPTKSGRMAGYIPAD